MQAFSTYCNELYQAHRPFLESNHPGLSIQVLLREMNEYFKKRRLEFSISDPAISYKNEVRTIFEVLLTGKPLAQIVESRYFYESEFFVNKHVLIPRSETEVLVEMAVSKIKASNRVLDLGTGSGAIILSILKAVDFKIEAVASDISEDALEVARKNYRKLGHGIYPESELFFVLADRFAGITGTFDLIVSNPPYIKQSEQGKSVHQNVDQFEPACALYLEDDLMEKWFIKLFEESYNYLNKNGLFLMEGHEDLIGSQKELLEKAGFIDVEVRKDLAGRDRFLKGKKDGKTYSKI